MRKSLLLTMSLLLVASLALAGGTGGVSGQVVDAQTGEPISGALVVACSGDDAGQARTNERGRYLIEDLDPGNYQVTARARGYVASRYPEKVVVEEGRTTPNIDFRLAQPPHQPGAISGRVTDAQTGKPIRGALVLAVGNGVRYRARTDARGRYLINRVLPGNYDVGCKARHYLAERYPQPVVVEAGQVTQGIDFALTPKPRPGAIAGRVTDARTGEPVRGALVIAHSETGFGRAMTDGHGYYVVRGLRPGDWQVTVAKRGYAPATFPRPVPVESGRVTRDIDFELRRLVTEAE